MNLENLKQAFLNNGCEKVYIKTLSPNDNSKNQVYLSGSYDVLSIFPISEIRTEAAGDWKKERFKASLRFSWITNEGKISHAPNAQFILYPKYPEVRFSGFLKGSENAPSDLMSQRMEDRLLFLGVAKNGMTLGFVSAPDSEITKAVKLLGLKTELGVFKIIDLVPLIDHRAILLGELLRIHKLGWINSKRLNKLGEVISCESPHCGGYTLEAELGVIPNGYSEPDYLGYEIKQFKVRSFDRISSEVLTLMTPQPDGGIYVKEGIDNFIRTYGYKDRRGREDRLNFGGIHKMGQRQPLTGLTLELIGFDVDSSKIRNANGSISLIDDNGNTASSWSYADLIAHWNRKHNKTCYVSSKSNIIPDRQYFYGNNVLLGHGTDFQLFLQQMALGNIYYDPGIKMEAESSSKPEVKQRSQFRTKSGNLTSLYHQSETVNLLAI